MYADIVQFQGVKLELGYSKVFYGKVLTELDQLKKIKQNELRIFQCNEFNVKQVLESKKVDIIIPIETLTKDSLHYRRSVMNHVMCRLAKENNVAVAFSLHHFLNAKNKSLMLGRLRQTVKLCRKYGTKMLFASFAVDKYGMRYYDNMLAFARTMLGMTPGEAKQALKTVLDIVHDKETLIAKGVRVVKDE